MKIHGALLAACVASAGCAAWAEHGVRVEPERRMRLALLPTSCSVRVEDPGRVSREVHEALAGELARHPEFEVVASTAAGGQAALQVDVGGYGKVKRSWLFWLIGSGVVEGAVQGALLAQVGGPWAGLGIAVEEVAQESLTWGGGAFVFNRVFTPVILDGELRSGADGARIWSKTALARINRRALKELPEERRKEKAVRLRLTAQKAAEELVDSLSKAFRRNAKRALRP
ncbi:MAG TPA: hypothetical protein VNI01_07635 [Elusimicrobiota bacterium]|jgi:hypothetical protein|nr:hypothetical protein [Elusimicrobiota bacterium]